MSEQISSNKRIAKNTIMLYLRMFLTMIVGLYTSRVVLSTLGVEDYGIYGVVGGVVSMLGFLNASMSGATSRFLTFELGRGDKERLAKTFSSALIVHIIIALIVLVISETVGLWFLCNKLVIPEGRMYAAHWVFQLSILSAMLGITQVPYNASIISHEKMDVYAYVEILNVTLKLLIVYLLVIGNFDKLILYAILTLAVSIIVMMIYRIYCLRKFEECHFHWIWEKEYLAPLLSFSGWDLYGNMSFTVVNQGRTFILNMFFGVAINAAAGIAATVQNILKGFSTNVTQAIRPQIIKAYSQNDICRTQNLIQWGINISIILMLVISVPFIAEAEFILSLWLGVVPTYAAIFCQLLLVQNVISSVNSFLIIGIHATGNVKKFFYLGTVSMIQIPVLYALFRFTDLPPQWTFVIMILWCFIDIVILCCILKVQIKDIQILVLMKNFCKILLLSLLSVFIVYVICSYLQSGVFRLFTVGLINMITLLVISYFFILPANIKDRIIAKIKTI